MNRLDRDGKGTKEDFSQVSGRMQSRGYQFPALREMWKGARTARGQTKKKRALQQNVVILFILTGAEEILARPRKE